jgi:hypothetical protein
MGPTELGEHCVLDDTGESLAGTHSEVRPAIAELGMSARAFHRTA